MIAGYKKPTNKQVILRQEGKVILGASFGCDWLKKGRGIWVVDECAGLRGIVAMVRPMRREYPK